MILVIPSMDLKDGECCRCIEGNRSTQDYYNNLSKNPESLLYLWRKENSKSIFISDMDSFDGANNFVNINSILYLSQIVDIPIQLYSRFSDIDECEMFLENGVQRIVLDSMFELETEKVKELISKYTPSRVVFIANSKDNFIEIPGCNKKYSDDSFFAFAKSLGSNRIVYNCISDENDTTKKIEELINYSKTYNIKITLKNGINDSKQLLNLRNFERSGIDSVILGKALYENKFPCQQIWRKVEKDLDCCKIN